MRYAWMVGLAALIGLVATSMLPEIAGGQGPRGSVYASAGSISSGSFRPEPGGALVAHFAASAGGPHTVTVIDPQRQVLGVYHVDAATGAITLKSVRNLSWDLQMIQFNSESPSPQDVRGGLRSAGSGNGDSSQTQRVRTADTEARRGGPIVAPLGG